jgi:hypothetical protein
LVLIVALAAASWLLTSFRNAEPGDSEGALVDAPAGDNWTVPPEAGLETVSLEVDFGNGARREYAALPWREGMTVGDQMRLAQAYRPGLRFSSTGQGELTLLTSLDGVANEGPGGRSWFYELDGQAAQQSYEVQPLAAGERVLWVFKRSE